MEATTFLRGAYGPLPTELEDLLRTLSPEVAQVFADYVMAQADAAFNRGVSSDYDSWSKR